MHFYSVTVYKCHRNSSISEIDESKWMVGNNENRTLYTKLKLIDVIKWVLFPY